MKRSQRALVLLLGSLLGCEPVRGPPPGGGQVSASPAQKKPSITATATTPPQVSSAPEPIRESPQALISPDDPLPPKVVRRLGTSRLWTNGYVYGLAFSDDSSVVTSINYLGVVERWKAATGELIDRFTPKNARFGQRFALSPNGSVVAMGERDAKDRFLISLWGIAEKSLKTQRKLGEARGIEQIALAADGRVAAANDDGLVRYFAAGATLPTLTLRGTGGRGGTLQDSESRMHVVEEDGVSLSPDGKWLASIHGDGTVRLYSLPKGTQRSVHLSFRSSPAPVFSRDSARFAYFGERGVRIVELATGKEADALPMGACDSVLAMGFSGDHFAATTDNRAVCLWDLKTRGAPEVRSVHGDRVEQLAFSPDGKLLASGGRDGSIFLWKIPSLDPALPFARHLGRVDSLALSSDGERGATGGIDGVAHVWDLKTGRVVFRRQNPHRFSKPWSDHPVKFSPDGKILYSATTGGGLLGWDIETGREVFHPEASGLCDIDVSPDGKLLAAIDSWGAATLFDTATGKPARSLSPQTSYSGHHVAFSRDGKFVASAGYDGPLALREVATGRLVTEQKGQAGYFFFASDGKRVGVHSYNKLTFYLIDSSGALREERSMTTKFPFAISPDQKYVAVSIGNSSIEVRDSQGGKAIATYAHREGTENLFMSAAEFTPDSALLAVSYSDGTTLLWRVK
jgi:WD40 repeat protein